MSFNATPRLMLIEAVPARPDAIAPARRQPPVPALTDRRRADYFEDLFDTLLDAELNGTLRH